MSDGRGRGFHRDPPSGSGIQHPPASARDGRDTGLSPESGICPGGGYGNPPQCSGLGNPTDRGASCMGGKELYMTEDALGLPIHSSYCISASVVHLYLQKLLIMFQPQSFCTCHPVTWKTEIFFFSMWTNLKVFIESVTTVCFTFCFLGMWDPSSPNRDWTHTPCTRR